MLQEKVRDRPESNGHALAQESATERNAAASDLSRPGVKSRLRMSSAERRNGGRSTTLRDGAV